MAEVAPAPAAAAPAAKTAKQKASMRKMYSPSAAELIVRAVAASKERGGVSASAVKKALAAGGYDVDRNKGRIKTAIKALVTKGTLVQTKGTGASGSFKISRKAADKPPKEVAVIARKPTAAKKPKTAAARKPVAAKKSPKKAKKPAAKSPKKAAKSPKKVTKSPKKVLKKAPKAKTPVKKAVKPKAKKAAPKKK